MPKTPRTYSIGSLRITRVPGQRRRRCHAAVALAVGIVLTAFHDLVYRSSDGADFELNGLISHAGADMLALTIAITIALRFVPDR